MSETREERERLARNDVLVASRTRDPVFRDQRIKAILTAFAKEIEEEAYARGRSELLAELRPAMRVLESQTRSVHAMARELLKNSDKYAAQSNDTLRRARAESTEAKEG